MMKCRGMGAIKRKPVGGLLARAGVAGAKYLSKKATEKSAKKAAQEKAKESRKILTGEPDEVMSDALLLGMGGAKAAGTSAMALRADRERAKKESENKEKAERRAYGKMIKRKRVK